MVYVTHDQTEALTFADKVVVMYDGEVVQIGTPQELFERPAHTFVGHFIGSPGMNVLPASVEGNVARVGGVDVPLARVYPDLAGKGKIEIGVRPEFLRVRAGEEGIAGDHPPRRGRRPPQDRAGRIQRRRRSRRSSTRTTTCRSPTRASSPIRRASMSTPTAFWCGG